MQRAERGFVLRMRRALRLTLEPLYEALQYDINVKPDMLKPNHIEDALRWLYVTWGFQQAVWFSRNFEFQKKNDVWMANLEGWFNTKGADKVTAILGTTRELIKPVLRDAVSWAADGLSIQDITKAVKAGVEREGGAISAGRARTIARTEVVGASNVTTHQVASEIGGNLEKRWITGGANIRESHFEAERQGWIRFDEPFLVPSSTGIDKMQHPHDPDASAENVINCKCVEIYRTIN